MILELHVGERSFFTRAAINKMEHGSAWAIKVPNEAGIRHLYQDVSCRFKGKSSNEHGSATYSGVVQFKPDEVLDLFAAMVRATGQSPEFKRLCLAAVKELRSKPRPVADAASASPPADQS